MFDKHTTMLNKHDKHAIMNKIYIYTIFYALSSTGLRGTVDHDSCQLKSPTGTTVLVSSQSSSLLNNSNMYTRSYIILAVTHQSHNRFVAP